jgi:hypothetical protein
MGSNHVTYDILVLHGLGVKEGCHAVDAHLSEVYPLCVESRLNNFLHAVR